MKNSKRNQKPSTIAQNRKARYEYHLDERFEAGLALQGWEVKSLRAGRCNLSESYIMLKDGEAWLFGCRSEEHTSELQSRFDLVCRLLLDKKNRKRQLHT